MNSAPRWLALPMLLTLSGCAVHHLDPATGTHSVYGFGVLRVRAYVSPAGQQAVATSVATAGATLDIGGEDYGLSLGIRRKDTLRIVADDVQVSLAYQQGALFGARFVDISPRSVPAPPPLAPASQ